MTRQWHSEDHESGYAESHIYEERFQHAYEGIHQQSYYKASYPSQQSTGWDDWLYQWY